MDTVWWSCLEDSLELPPQRSPTMLLPCRAVVVGARCIDGVITPRFWKWPMFLSHKIQTNCHMLPTTLRLQGDSKHQARRAILPVSIGHTERLLFSHGIISGHRFLFDTGLQKIIQPATKLDVLANGHGPRRQLMFVWPGQIPYMLDLRTAPRGDLNVTQVKKQLTTNERVSVFFFNPYYIYN